MSIVWYVPTEMKIYEGEFALPQQKIYNLFKEGYMRYSIPIESKDGKETLHWETYNSLTIGLAPKGMVVVWMDGQNKIEIGRYQARELDRKEANEVYKAHFKSSGDMPEAVVEKELRIFFYLVLNLKSIIYTRLFLCIKYVRLVKNLLIKIT
ncbi:DUF2931 family protein [Flavobacterium sp. HSC-32F16]|uniref:DUF2931 family protein n=1 Tax=Flavobacterium sp. HSC-32F16 TaxID=2910964 RepID=UPI0020A2C4CF